MNLDDRMKQYYESIFRQYLPKRIPVIMRLDGKAFHTLTRKMERPFDKKFQETLSKIMLSLCKYIQGAKLGYTQSDEISILITDFDKLDTQGWFDYNIQKMVSISSAFCSTEFYGLTGIKGLFDSRVFSIPKEEVSNYFLWRQQDWIRNSVSMLAQSLYSQKELLNKNSGQLHELIHKKGMNWTKLQNSFKNGVFACYEKCSSSYDYKEWVLRDEYIVKNSRAFIESLFDSADRKE